MAPKEIEGRRNPRKSGVAPPATILLFRDLPLPTSPTLQMRVSSPHPVRGETSSGGKKSKIAIVEDEGDLLSICSDFFRNLGFDSVSSFDNGEDLLRAVSRGSVAPDLVIMDYRLPGKDGLETAKLVVDANPATRIVITTADDAIKTRTLGMGFVFLQKPFSISELLGTVKD